MKKSILFSIIAFLVFSNTFSQVNKDGIPLIKKYTDKDYGDVGQIWAIEQDNRGVMYFGCNFGLKTFDGKNWKSYNNPYSTIVKSLAVSKEGIVFYGAESDFGMFQPNSIGRIKFHSFRKDKYKEGDSLRFTSVWKTTVSDNKVFFQSFEKLFYINLPIKLSQNDSLINEIHTISPTTLFHLSFTVNNDFYIREWERGICKVVGNKLELIPGGEEFGLLRVYTMLPYDKDKILIGTREKGFFIYDKTNKNHPIKPFSIGNNTDIINSALYSGEVLPNGNFVIGTLVNGLFIFDKKGNIVNHYGENVGLPNGKVLSIFYNDNDPSAQLWFTYPNHGLFRADVSGTFNLWNKFKGLEGITNDITRFKHKLYIVSDNSLYILNEQNEVKFNKIYSESESIWDLFVFTDKFSNEKKLLMSGFSGVYEVKDSIVEKIVDVNNAHTLYQSSVYKNRLFIGSDDGLSYIDYKDNAWTPQIKLDFVKYQIGSIMEDEKYLKLGALGRGVFVLEDLKEKNNSLIDTSKGLPLLGKDIFLKKINNKTVIINGAGFYENIGKDSIARFNLFGNEFCNSSKGVYSFVETQNSYWMSTFNSSSEDPDFNIIRFIGKKELIKDSTFAKIIPKKSTFCIYPDSNFFWISNEKGLYKFNNDINNNYNIQYKTIITRIATFDSLLFAGNYIEKTDSGVHIVNNQNENSIPILSFKNNMLAFNWTAPYFVKENETKYSYRLVGHSDNWSNWNVKSDTRYTNLTEGDYTFEVKAKNIYNIDSSVASYSFTILPPWYRTVWAYILFTVLGILFILLIIKLYTKKLKAENEKLEQTVKERTAEIRQQNEEITAQRDEIHEQKEAVEKAKDKIEKQKESIMDSIHYASRIQEAVLPPENYLKEILGEHFVLFRPRDIVSGDFYWATRRGNKTIIVAADSTGHGVPGAFMSMLGMSFLNEIINKDEVLQANIILNRLRDNVKRSLRQTGKENEAKDGMDLALCVIDTDEMKLQFAGAYNPLYLLRNNEIIRVKADRMPIGIYLREKESFTNNIIDLQKGDLLYIFSDGYVDQFGGKNDSKIKSAKFKELLLENCNKPMEQQKAALVNFLEGWMDNYDKKGRKYSQIDDILVIGIEI